MNDEYVFKPVSFAEVCNYIEKQNNSKLKDALKHILSVGVLLFPAYITQISGVPSSLVTDIATGATLVGAGVGKIIVDTVHELLQVRPDKNCNTNNFLKAETAYYLCFFSAFYETLTENVIIEGYEDIWEFLQEVVSGNQRGAITEEIVENNETIYLSIGNNEKLKNCFNMLNKQFKKNFFLHDFINQLEEYADVQKNYYMNIFDSIPDKALKKFERYIFELSMKYPYVRHWISIKVFNELNTQVSTLPQIIADQVLDGLKEDKEKIRILKKELYQRNGDRYFYFFEDEQCNVDDMFILSNYFIKDIEKMEEKQRVKSLETLMYLAEQQKFLLITGPYGSGKTVLLKKLYLEYKRHGLNIFAFEAKDLIDIVSVDNADEFCDFFMCLCGKDKSCTVLIDAMDDLNIPNADKSERSLLEVFISKMFNCIKRNRGIVFILSSREYAYIKDNKEASVAEKIYCLGPEGMKMKLVSSEKFSTEAVSLWIEQYPFKNNIFLNKKTIKDSNKKIVSALQNPLFLYVFIKQYEKTQKLEVNEGYYYYYEHFINYTIQGKYRNESNLGATVIRDKVEKYRDLVQRIAFDILNINSSRINDIINSLKLMDEEPVLAEELQKYKFYLTFDDFSKATTDCFKELQSDSIEKANYLNCYFLKAVDNTVFFLDANILFTLAAERIFAQLEFLARKDVFEISHLDKLDVIDFYPQIIDYIIYKLRNSNVQKVFRGYLRSFVLNEDIRNRIDVSGKSNKQLRETFAQIIMMYILFFKTNKSSLASDYVHIFKEMMHYVNAYKTYSHGFRKEIYPVERYFMRSILQDLHLKRVNLTSFNFKDSTIDNGNFFQCKFEDTNFINVTMMGKTEFVLCKFEKSHLLVAPNAKLDNMDFKDCQIKQLTLKVQKCRFLRCFIQQLDVDLSESESLKFDDCVIEKFVFVGNKSDVETVIEFNSCVFKTPIDLREYAGKIKINTKCCYVGTGQLFSNISKERVENPERIM